MNKVAVVNRTNLKNFGSVLQVYALCVAIRKLGYDVEVVWQSGNMSKNFDMRPNKVFKTGMKLLRHPSLLWSTYKTIHCCPEKFYHKVGCSTEPASGTLTGVVG